MSTSSTAQLQETALCQDYWGEAHTKFPLPAYPKEEAYSNLVQYEHTCQQDAKVKKQVLAQQQSWVEWEQVADHEQAAEMAQAQPEPEKHQPYANEGAGDQAR